MAGIFRANELVAMAVEIEKRGESFYRDMSRRVTKPVVKEALEFLAEEEAKHEARFSELKSRLDPMELPTGSAESEYWAYVNDLIGSHFLFLDSISQKLISTLSTDKEIVHLAMSFEKESILFFMEMRGLIPHSEHPVVDACIEEERSHLRKLSLLLRETG
jgi:rubrerythrin